METYITGPAIKRLREARGLTQAELGEKIGVGSKAVSKWENARGLPDVSLIEPLAEALGVSVMELMNGEKIRNQNVSANMLRTKICVCPVCGNILCGTGSAVISCRRWRPRKRTKTTAPTFSRWRTSCSSSLTTP